MHLLSISPLPFSIMFGIRHLVFVALASISVRANVIPSPHVRHLGSRQESTGKLVFAHFMVRPFQYPPGRLIPK